MEGWAPARVTEIAAAAAAKLALSASVLPSMRPVAKAPLKVSPAAVLSMAFTAKDEICASVVSLLRNAPREPSFRMMFCSPALLRVVAISLGLFAWADGVRS